MTNLEKELNRRADIIIRQEKQIQIDAEQIRALQKRNGELTDKVNELEHQLTHRNCLDCSNHSSKLRMRTLELEKENAELNEKVNILDNCDRLGDMITEAYKDQLTKAKEILHKVCYEFGIYNKDLMEEAKQFLKDLEK